MTEPSTAPASDGFGRLGLKTSMLYGAVYLHYGVFAIFMPVWLKNLGLPASQIGILVSLPLLLRILFVAPVSALVAGFFLDELAERVEADPGPVGRALPAGAAIWIGAKFALVSVAVNLVALLVFLIPGVNVAVFFVANAYLFGREYFELAAMRYRPVGEATELRRRHAVYLFFCGLPIALMVAPPVLPLLTPMFAIAYMTRIHRGLAPGGATAVQPA